MLYSGAWEQPAITTGAARDDPRTSKLRSFGVDRSPSIQCSFSVASYMSKMVYLLHYRDRRDSLSVTSRLSHRVSTESIGRKYRSDFRLIRHAFVVAPR